MEGVEFRVLDTNNEDITRAILLQIMLEEESGGEPLFSAQMLAQIIRFYRGTLQGMLSRYMERSLDLFVKQQHQLRRRPGARLLDAMVCLAQRNVDIWADLQNEFGAPLATRSVPTSMTASPDRAKTSPRSSLARPATDPRPLAVACLRPFSFSSEKRC